MSAIQNRYEFAYLFDVANGNPNGDPDAGNLPRLDPETSQGLVTDVCLKRKIRNYVQMAKASAPGLHIYIQERAILNRTHEQAYKDNALPPSKKPPQGKAEQIIRGWLCGNYYDIRTFGAVMSTGDYNCGQVRGPAQFAFARSIEPIVPLEISITRMAVASEREAEKQDDIRTMAASTSCPTASTARTVSSRPSSPRKPGSRMPISGCSGMPSPTCSSTTTRPPAAR
jgi:CRISPR-associated protein Csd2